MKTISVLFSILLLISGCGKDQVNGNFEDDPSITDISGTWLVVSYEDLINNTIIEKSDVDSWNGLDVTLTFTIDSIFGRNTTNIVSGKFFISGRNINVTSFGGTKLGQPEWGNMFTDIVYHLETFKVNKKQLRFFYNDSKNSVTLVQK